MDRVTRVLLDEFVTENGLNSLDDDEAFEHFTSYLLVSSHYSNSVEAGDVVVGAGGDCGIDAIAVLVNGTIVTEPEEVEDLASTNGYLNVTFVFVQAERSESFETAKIGQFTFGVRDFFSEKPQLQQNEPVRHYCSIARELLNRSRLFKAGNPQCHLYYATTGRWTDDADLTARRNAGRADVEAIGIFRRVTFECIGVDRLQQLYREAQNAVLTEIVFPARTVIPEIPGVDQAYLGYCLPRSF